jgi:hypothetical protein
MGREMSVHEEVVGPKSHRIEIARRIFELYEGNGLHVLRKLDFSVLKDFATTEGSRDSNSREGYRFVGYCIHKDEGEGVRGGVVLRDGCVCKCAG